MNTSTQYGIGSFLQGFTQGFEKTQELRMKRQELDLKQATLASEQAKLDLSLQKEANEKQLKTQQEMRKAQEYANKSFEENAGKYGAKVAVDRFNSTISTSDNPTRKFIWTDLNGGEHIIDTTSDAMDGLKFANAEYLTKKGNGKYNFDTQTSTVYGKNADGQFIPTNYTGTDVSVFKNAYEKSQEGKGYTWVSDGKGGSRMVKESVAAELGLPKYNEPSKAQEKSPSAYDTVTVSTLPNAVQEKLFASGYKPTDRVTNTFVNSVSTGEFKPQTEWQMKKEQFDKAVENGYTGSYQEWASTEYARGKAIGEGVKSDTNISIDTAKKEKLFAGKNPSEININTPQGKMVDAYYRDKINKKEVLFAPKDLDVLKSVDTNKVLFDTVTDPKAMNVTGIADNLLSMVKGVSGIGMDVEQEARVKSAFSQMGHEMARNMNGPGALSNQDVKAGSKALGSLWSSDRATAGTIKLAVDKTVLNLEAIRNAPTTDKSAFDFYYGKTLNSFKEMQNGLIDPKSKVITKEDFLGSNNTSNSINIEYNSLKQIMDKNRQGNK